MKIDTKEILTLQPAQKELLQQYRRNRNFQTENYLKRKIAKLHKYCQKYNIDTLIVLSSGGIDSAVVAAICKETTLKHPKINLELVTLPNLTSSGVTRQNETVELSQKLANKLETNLTILPLDKTVQAITENCNLTDDWGIGQTVCYARTTTAYSYATKLWAQGKRAIIVGTTNLDEGAYIGYIGKASDAMVDLQLISDLHKNEVYQIAKHFNLPTQIINAIPQGDMYHAAKDEEIFGCTYDAIELFYAINSHQIALTLDADTPHWQHITHNIETLHTYNKHKYLGCSPAVHIDVMPAGEQLTHGWKYNNWNENR